MIEKSEIVDNIISSRRGKEYDVAVMFSGGKDSSFLLKLLMDVYKVRVKAVMVDNGFENDGVLGNAVDFLKKNNIDYDIIRPKKMYFKYLYKMLIIDNKLFKKENANHFCFICNSILWANVVNYAHKNDIPYVASGMDLAQLCSGRKTPLLVNAAANSIAEKSTKVIFNEAYKAMKKSDIYNSNKEFQEYINEINYKNKDVKTVYPYIYHEIPVEELKSEIIKIGWTPPGNVDVKGYVSSGCMLMKYVVGELEKVNIIVMNEREQARQLFQKGLLGEEHMDYILYDSRKNKVNLESSIFNELEVKEYLLNICKKENKEVVY